MKKTIIFDLKNTLVNDQGEWLKVAKEALAVGTSSTANLILYSMNEPWTYAVLGANEQEFSQFEQIILVSAKKVSDLEQFDFDDVLVIGDSVTEELAFAKVLGYDTLQIQGSLPAEPIKNFLQRRSS